jgi:beta-phosphoglucomutase-like phosphatase (HAD superfamily)
VDANGPAPRIRPHVAQVLTSARHVLLDFDGVMFDVRAAMPDRSRERAVTDLLNGREYRPRPLLIPFASSVHETLAYLVEHEPDHAEAAEALVTGIELDACLTASPAEGLGRLLDVCAATGRSVAVISDLAEGTVLAALRAHQLSHGIRAVAARQGLDLDALDAGRAAERIAHLLGAPLHSCIVVSGRVTTLSAAQQAGALGLGCQCRRDSRKHLARGRTPVVSSLAVLNRALSLFGPRS